jgi:adenylosuccinate lyase
VWQEGADFRSLLKADKMVTDKLSDAALAEIFDLGYHTKNVDKIFARVFSPAAKSSGRKSRAA